jgi:MYXO-CTERM domain-containing protein
MRATAILSATLLMVGTTNAGASSVTVTTPADLAAAIAAAQAGDVITIADGGYTIGATLSCAASSSGPAIIVRAADPHQVVLTAAGNVSDVFLVTGQGWQFNGIDVKNAGQSAWHIKNAGAAVSISNATISDSAVDGIFAECGGPDVQGMGHCDQGTIDHVQITRSTPVSNANCHDTAGIEIVGGQGWTLTHNRVTNLAVDPTLCTTDFGILLRGGATGATVTGNFVSGADVGIAAGSGTASSACQFRGATGTPPSACTVPSPACEDNRSQIANNVIIDSSSTEVLAFQACGTRIENDTLWNNRPDVQSVGSVLIEGALSAMVPVQNVLLDAAVRDSESGTHVEMGNLLLPRPADVSFFIDALMGNFRLVAGAPALDSGVTLTDVPVDYDGIPRPQGKAYDVGAFERPLAGYGDGGTGVDGGSSGTSGMVNGGGSGSSGGASLPPKGGCGCQLGEDGAAGSIAAALLCALVLLLAARRRA